MRRPQCRSEGSAEERSPVPAAAHLAGGWLAVAMVVDVAATKFATTAADCGACCDAGDRVKNLAATREAWRPR
ncbi:hypothetical protein OsI_05825 [Oryza sativa Indica Group]|uniref:Uncharacterized protein n=1 Tax=Oryza sativa subsp. indica TaxID=39946 RepID=B8AHG9_ORYSI|nr:hypothetical protein OsI_05825 [Oryza sativa Indica Group]